jgi:hypothetical protein
LQREVRLHHWSIAALRRRLRKKQVLHACVKSLEGLVEQLRAEKGGLEGIVDRLKEDKGSLETRIEVLRLENIRLDIKAMEYWGRWISDARVIRELGHYVEADVLADVLTGAQANDDARSSPFYN